MTGGRGHAGRWPWALGVAGVAAAAAVLAVLVVVVPGEGGTQDRPAALARVAALETLPPGLGRCRRVVAASEAERRRMAEPLARALAEDGQAVDPGAAAEALAAGCQTARPTAPAAAALATLAASPRPWARVCRSVRADLHRLMGLSAGALGGMRRASALFEEGRRPRLEQVHRALSVSGLRARALAARLAELPVRTAEGRELRRGLRLLAADWANHARAYTRDTTSAGALVRRVGAGEAVDLLRVWLDGAGSVRERADRVERRANDRPAGVPPTCRLSRIALLG